MSKPFFSILIPAYKPNYDLFDECIKSIVSQTGVSFEIIVCDQGREDLTHFLKKYGYIKRIHLSEPSSYKSRILLYQEATGEYILFADCDDIYLDGSFKWLYDQINLWHRKDLYIYDCENIPYLETQKKNFTEKEGFKEISKPECKYLLFNRKIKNMIFLKCFKNKRGLIFPDEEVFMGEDVLLSYTLISSSKTICVSNSKLYGYRDNPNSGTKNIRPSYITDELKVFNRLSKIESSKNLLISNWEIVYKAILNYMISLYAYKNIDRRIRKSILKDEPFISFKKFFKQNKKDFSKKKDKKVSFIEKIKFCVLFNLPFWLSKTIVKIYMFLFERDKI